MTKWLKLQKILCQNMLICSKHWLERNLLNQSVTIKRRVKLPTPFSWITNIRNFQYSQKWKIFTLKFGIQTLTLGFWSLTSRLTISKEKKKKIQDRSYNLYQFMISTIIPILLINQSEYSRFHPQSNSDLKNSIKIYMNMLKNLLKFSKNGKKRNYILIYLLIIISNS